MTVGLFRCGHFKVPSNLKRYTDAEGNGRIRCRTCHVEATKRYQNNVPAELIKLERRVRYLPKQLEATRRKLAALENEARRYGMHDLVGGGQ